ncbi:O-antigen ligase family protein [Leptospira yasudae]|uniref:O-antigen ligase family protein n=1 Tax=Leptospira yasudae TaxID=2202201 RepID=UPI001083300A|nr:O-antigen ligase family protein [Leptospira yasudae]TGK24712.1 O-antigen ligase family protein [Leptospira yasudae]TGM09403.1 O-antigen ligase family protein [Leptospira yasudae]
MSQVLNIKILPLPLLAFALSLLFFFDPSNPALSRDSVVFAFFVWVISAGISFKKKNHRIHPLFLLVCLLLIGLSTINGINRAPVVYFPQKVNIKLLYGAALCITLILYFKNVHPIFLFIHTIAFACSTPLFSSIKSIPLLLFIIASFFYLAPRRIVFSKLHGIVSLFFVLISISSLISYKSQAALMQLCLLLSGILVFFLISSYPSRFLKKGLLVILCINLLLNTINLLSAVHLIWPFDFWKPPMFLTYAGFPVSAIGVISAFSALVAFYTAIQYSNHAWYLLPSGFLSLYLAFFNQSRASLLAFTLGALSMILFRLSPKRFFFRTLIASSLILLSIAFGLILLLPEESVARYFSPETLFIRFSLWKFHFQSVLENSPIFGIGLDADSLLAHFPGSHPGMVGYEDFYRFLHSFRSYPQAHNLYVEAFTSFGILGFFVFLSVAGFLSFVAYRMLVSQSKETARLGIFTSGILVFVAAHEFFDFNLGEQHFFIPATLCMSLIRVRMSSRLGTLKAGTALFKIVYGLSLLLLSFLCFQLTWEQRLRNLIIVSTQNEIELDNFSIYKEKQTIGKRKKISYPTEEIVKNRIWIRSEENLILASLVLRKDPKYQNLAESLLDQCVQKYPYSSVCRKERAEVLRNKDPKSDFQTDWAEGRKTDPFHIIFTE